ncbi:MAG TPA: hypothetical protein VEX86_00370 [Longimicrobium sp.]|nr:hypothetical protein [Longimicrobium sp.]
MNQKKKWVERHGRVVRDRRSRAVRFSDGTPPRWFRNMLNRRVRHRDTALLRRDLWEDFTNRVVRDASWYW